MKECIEYAQSLLDQLPSLSKQKKSRFLGLIDKIKKRAESPYLHTALIGDFSTGKSTFINVLLDRELLKAAWYATTAVPTVIYCHVGEQVRVMAETYDGGKYVLDHPQKRRQLEEKLQRQIPLDEKDALALLTTSNDLADQIKRIRIRVPDIKELEHICLIDTPGVNPGAEEARSHVQKTRDVLREYADTTIILFQATQVYSASFQVFLKENAEHFMNDAVFVITMMDLIYEDQRDNLIEFSDQRKSRRTGRI